MRFYGLCIQQATEHTLVHIDKIHTSKSDKMLQFDHIYHNSNSNLSQKGKQNRSCDGEKE